MNPGTKSGDWLTLLASIGLVAIVVAATCSMVTTRELPVPPPPAPARECPVDLRVVHFEEMVFERKMGIDGVWARCTTNIHTKRIDCLGKTTDREVAYFCTDQGCEWAKQGEKP